MNGTGTGSEQSTSRAADNGDREVPVPVLLAGAVAGHDGGSPTLHVVLYQPEIPDNTGNVGRTCVALGAKLWLVRPLGFRLDDRHLRRAGLDYWQHLDWEAVDDWPALLARLPACRPWFFTKHAATIYTRAVFGPGDVLVFGSESQGLPRLLLEAHPDRCLRIPMAPEARSLNLAVSVAVAAFEACRQRDAR